MHSRIQQTSVTTEEPSGSVVLTSLGGPDEYIFFSGLGFRDIGVVMMPTETESGCVKALSLEVRRRKRSWAEKAWTFVSA